MMIVFYMLRLHSTEINHLYKSNGVESGTAIVVYILGVHGKIGTFKTNWT